MIKVTKPEGKNDFVILVYDANVKRVAKFLKICRKYLTWVQNSVFEGYLTKGKLKKLIFELEKVMNANEDSVIIYKFNSAKYSKRIILGIEKSTADDFIF